VQHGDEPPGHCEHGQAPQPVSLTHTVQLQVQTPPPVQIVQLVPQAEQSVPGFEPPTHTQPVMWQELFLPTQHDELHCLPGFDWQQ
jgi:hypothetical protein